MPIVFFPLVSKKSLIPLLFLHIPKCGGTSVEQSFLKAGCYIKLHDRIDHQGQELLTNKLIYKCPSQHFHYAILEKFLDFRIFRDVFALVRNPYSRLASEYRFVSGRVGGSPQQFDIDRWVNLVFDKYFEDPFVLCNHIRPQVDFVAPGKTRIFKLENGIESMMRDVMGRLVLEQGLRSDDLLTKKVVIPRENLTRKKLSNGISREEEVMRQSSSLSLRIKDFYAEDFKTFYPKDL